jgi:zinc protease
VNISYSKHVFSNGLRVLFHKDKNSPLAAVNVLYDVGARDENPNRTGFAHLFEHLMFGGSKHVPSYDTPLQKAGGENNAFTSNDITNYYITIPKENIETAFWLESDRMLQLDFSENSLEVQRKVVVEEFNQRYLNQPYGDLDLLFRPLCYKVHPYQWSTIGKNIQHIEEAILDEVKDFYNTHYNPGNAILCVSGDLDEDFVFQLAEKWFGQIDKKHSYIRNILKEPEQFESRWLEVERDVPNHCIVIGFHMTNRLHNDYYAFDLLSDILSQGNSSRLTQQLIKNQQLFSNIDAYITGSLDEGQLVFKGDLLPNVSIEQAEKAIWEQIETLKNEQVSVDEMIKVIHQAETSNIFRNVNLLNKAMNLAFYELLGDANLINTELDNYKKITAQDIMRISNDFLKREKSSTLLYKSSNLQVF